VTGPNVALADAVPDTGPVVITNFDAAAGEIVAPCVPDVSPDAAALNVGEPATVSP
jgi:hypothetical protein